MALKYQIFFAVIAAFIVMQAFAATVSLNRRSLASNASATNTSVDEEPAQPEKQREVCLGRTPCGWAVYNLDRYVTYFMRSTCWCPEEQEKKCMKDDDDISLSAYVYRCKYNSSEVVKSLTVPRDPPLK